MKYITNLLCKRCPKLFSYRIKEHIRFCLCAVIQRWNIECEIWFFFIIILLFFIHSCFTRSCTTNILAIMSMNFLSAIGSSSKNLRYIKTIKMSGYKKNVYYDSLLTSLFQLNRSFICWYCWSMYSINNIDYCYHYW